MKFFAAISLLAATALAAPAETVAARDVQTVHLKFNAGPVSYDLALPADGTFHPTPRPDLNVNIIDALDFNAFDACHFTFANGATPTLVSSVDPKDGSAHIIVGPPAPVTGVSCQGTCIATYGDCYRNGQFLGVCCNGFCAANKCRPFVQPS